MSALFVDKTSRL